MPIGEDTFADHLEDFVGKVVTIFTTSGGDSGAGFTGVLLAVNEDFVRLLTRMGPAPACALGNCCSGIQEGVEPGQSVPGGPICGGTNTGSIADIPIDRIASFAHNTI
ncbi:hypothetical protein K144313037_08450 [Clostridium tetani]|uniref:Uncharacterized protein n=1 Tax=Clostridium tetani (strain Massachusetts / E88) TaxID=212717 RepID=Q896I9_CLOTE|nr:hypothetical protein [Clostridium tetani]AAO35601.1 hypothetical protein CTC_01015 [Clostridium tetani E88]AVP54439.1 hypothetical protein C3B72_04580 [Clostridium tetani]KGI37001.1 hypothetical protein KY52_11845 [Clostridium tetani]KGI40392.1 hypothetical protein LA33_07030 [Clostridium tetani ATCC 9441]KGI42426.1 hypothetical protein KY55_10090 [Clostridium tetani]